MNGTDFLVENLASSYNGFPTKKGNANNKYTSRRRRLSKDIIERSGGDLEKVYYNSLEAIKNELPRVQEYVFSHGETPASNIQDLAKQALKLRLTEIDSVAKTLSVPTSEAQIMIEESESTRSDNGTNEADAFLGETFGPVYLAGTALAQEGYDSFMDAENGSAVLEDSESFLGGLLKSVVSLGTDAVGDNQLRRAAEGKTANAGSVLFPGGKKGYLAFRDFLNKNPKVKQGVLAGTIRTLEDAGFAANSNGGYDIAGIANAGLQGLYATGNVGNALEAAKQKAIDDEKKKEIKKMIPYIIGGLVLLGVVVFLIVKKRK